MCRQIKLNCETHYITTLLSKFDFDHYREEIYKQISNNIELFSTKIDLHYRLESRKYVHWEIEAWIIWLHLDPRNLFPSSG